MKQSHRDRRHGYRYALALFTVACLGFGCKGGMIPNSTNAAPHLDERNARGDYSPYYQSGDMNQPRYYHSSIRLKNQLVLVSGGTDENGFSTFDTAELFDESNVSKDELRPPSLSGVWLDTDFEGNPITMEFRRMWHTLTMLPDNTVIVIGGANNFLKAIPYEKVEIFDPDKRTFTTLDDAKMIVPRVRHTANFLKDGNILIAGGQFHDIFTNIQTQQQTGGGQGSGTVTITQQTDIFPTTNRVELFNFRDLTFSELTYPDSTKPSMLPSSRGRAGHAATLFAGPDNHNNTGDDLLFIVGGYQTPSATAGTGDTTLVPALMVTRGQNLTNMRTIDIYDSTQHLFTQVGTVLLAYPRVNDPAASNLGIFNEYTPDGVLGLGNVILVALGDDNAQNCMTTAFSSEMFTATFTGFGPAQGLVIHAVNYTTAEDGHNQDIEFVTAGGATSTGGGRCGTQMVALPRIVETTPGKTTTSTWLFTGVGFSSLCAPPFCPPCTEYGAWVASGVLFDPFYKLIPAADFSLDPKPSGRELKPTRDPNINPTGVMGTWLGLDGKLPSADRVGFADTDPATWGANKVNRVFGRLEAIAGEDGIIDTTDDRILFTGGGTNGVGYGGEVSLPSCELLIIPASPP